MRPAAFRDRRAAKRPIRTVHDAGRVGHRPIPRRPRFAVAMAAPAPRLEVDFRLVPEFVGTDQVQGRIVVSVTNAGDQPLRDVTLRVAQPGPGQLSGDVNEQLDLRPHETRSVEGRFRFDSDLFEAATPSPGTCCIATPRASCCRPRSSGGRGLWRRRCRRSTAIESHYGSVGACRHVASRRSSLTYLGDSFARRLWSIRTRR